MERKKVSDEENEPARLKWVSFKRLNSEARIPKYATSGSAGFDFHAIEDLTIAPGETKLVKTGLSFEIPEGYEIQVRPRSGNSLKTKMRVANSPGTLDSDYRGEVCVIIENTSNSMSLVGLGNLNDIHIKKGDKIAQGVLTPVYQAFFVEKEELSETDRGEGGFGHSGK